MCGQTKALRAVRGAEAASLRRRMDHAKDLAHLPWTLGSARIARVRVSKISKISKIGKFWRARSRLYQNELLQENMRLTAFFKIYKMCTRLHRSKLNILAKHLF